MAIVADCFVSIVAPLQNDADIVGEYVDEVMAMFRQSYENYELVLVDDGSTDDTVSVVKSLLLRHDHLRLIRLSRRFGQEIAISAGLDSVIGDYIAVMLPDSDPPQLVPKMVEQSRSGVGVVYGVRAHRKKEPILLRLGAGVFYWLCRRVLQLQLPKNVTHFRVLSRQAVNAIVQIRDQNRYLSALSQYVGFAEQAVIYEPISRRSKPRRKSLGDALNLAVNIIVANSLYPLRLAAWMGFLLAFANVLYMLFVLAVFLLKETPPEGWSTMSMVNAVMFFFILLILAIVSEYLGRLFNEVKGRPLYYVQEEANSSVLVSGEERKNVVTEAEQES